MNSQTTMTHHFRCIKILLSYLLTIATLLCPGCAQHKESLNQDLKSHEQMSYHDRNVKVPEIPFERQLQMREGDALEFELPNGKTVAVWCERPGLVLGEQTTASGLKTAWGERPFKKPEVVREQIAPNSYRLAGWKSYISQGAVTTSTGDQTTESLLYVGDLEFSIIENLRGTPSLPVTIRISKKCVTQPRTSTNSTYTLAARINE
jgi:hypothetical protein